MSNNKLVTQPVTSEARSSDPLDTLVAKKDLDGVAVQDTFDLANASIQNADVLRAIPRKVARRSVISDPNRVSKQSPQAKRSATTPQKHGLIKNPMFKYEGGVINKLLSFFANLLKVIEQFVLGALGNRVQSVFFSPSISNKAKKESAVEEQEEEKEDDEELNRNRNDTQLTIKRS